MLLKEKQHNVHNTSGCGIEEQKGDQAGKSIYQIKVNQDLILYHNTGWVQMFP